jgi:flagellar biosynthesis/type III secretory pathway protein FliH
LLEINELLASDDEGFIEIGLFLYRRNNGENGLSKNEVETLIKMIHNIQSRVEKEIAEELEKEYDKGYCEGFDEGQRNCDCE